jgi:hypothetical protein
VIERRENLNEGMGTVFPNKNIREFHHLREILVLYFHEQLLFQMFPVTYEEIGSTLQQLLCRMFLDDKQKDYHG